jgi:antitoxin (DNA-binding transcriptional repressor) of toxin-antitoxin stability system
MKDINVSELKAHLSRYLRMASQGIQIVVKDRDQPIAQIGPPAEREHSWRDRLAAQGRLHLGNQDWGNLVITKCKQKVRIQDALDAVREEPHEVRRR